MIVDSSAIMAIVLAEPDGDRMLATLGDASSRQISAGTWLESCIVVNQRHQPGAAARFETLLAKLQLAIVPVTADQAVIARSAYERFGRGNHPARLNYGDCFAYALAKVTGEPLLFKGTDFSQTDITPALRA